MAVRPFFQRMLIFSMSLLVLNVVRFVAEPKYTYIQTIDLPAPFKEKITRFLGETDAATGGLFSRKSLRPVTIKMGPLDLDKMAQSEMSPLFCTITLNSYQDWRDEFTLKTTILHELGHAFGFWFHDSAPDSVMYWSDSPLVNDDSINRFLVRLKRKGNL